MGNSSDNNTFPNMRVLNFVVSTFSILSAANAFVSPQVNTVKNSIGERNKVTVVRAANLPDVAISSPLGVAGKAMGLISPIFALEAKLQAGLLVSISKIIGGSVDPEEIRAETLKKITGNKAVMYTYGLSPFSTEAKNILEAYDVEVIELGAEWFLLGPEASERRIVLAENSENDQTSLPHLFVKGESLGGLSTGGRKNEGILGLVESGELDKVLKKKGAAGKKFGWF